MDHVFVDCFVGVENNQVQEEILEIHKDEVAYLEEAQSEPVGSVTFEREIVVLACDVVVLSQNTEVNSIDAFCDEEEEDSEDEQDDILVNVEEKSKV